MDVFMLSFFAVFASFFCVLPSESSSRCKVDEDTLELVQILYRHGDRAPVDEFPTDEHKDYWKIIGLGQLTNIGKEQHYELGQFIRNRYAGFLNESYNKAEVVVRSTDYDRTLMSAESNLAGLYPPKDDQIWNPDLKWQPIPVHTVPNSIEYLMGNAPCPKYEQALSEVMNSSEVRKLNEQYKDLFDFLSNATGLEIMNISDAGFVHDNLLCELKHNLSMPCWVNDTIYDVLTYIDQISFKLFYVTPVEQRLSAGPLVKEMLANARDKVSGKISARRAFIYSGHDTTITALLSTLGVYNEILVPYASAVFVELHRPPVTGDPYSVRIMYRNTTAFEPYELIVPNCAGTCGMLCPLDRLAQILKPLLPDDIVLECGLPSDV